jgi:predicted small secreted protein
MNTLRKLLWITLTLASCAGLGACNTVKGLGQDIQKAGSAIENAVKK